MIGAKIRCVWDKKKPRISGAHKNIIVDLFGHLVHSPGQGALQVGGLVLMDHTTLDQLVDIADHRGELFICFLLGSQCFKVTNGVTGGLAIIAIPFPALRGLPNVFFSCLVICHDAAIDFLGRQR
jgi:hypothetical protein